MFKSKVDFNVFDKHNTKVKNLELTKAKALAKAGVKKLQGNHDTPTNFHIALNYFKDAKDNPLGHFIGFGDNKKLDKHFLQVEMKSGKADKSMTSSPKEASLGKAYVKDINGKNTLCLEPDPSSKIPQGKWPKLLKELKAWFTGMKAVAIFNGQVVEEEVTETEETSKDNQNSDTNNQEAIQQGKQQLATQLGKMDQGIQKIDKAIGKTSKVKLMENVEKYEKALETLVKKAKADGIIDKTEQVNIDKVTEMVTALRTNVEERGSRITPEKRQKINTTLKTIKEELRKMKADFK